MRNQFLELPRKRRIITRKDINSLYKYAFIDLMTGLKNRNAYEEKLKFFRSNRSKLKGLHVVVFDIDGLKAINDNYGHNRGDEAIKIVGKCLTKVFRDTDFCVRMGGDEFVCFSYNDVSDNIAEFNRLLELESYYLEYTLSVSIGITTYDERKDKGIDSLIKRGDNLMYMKKKAKHSERCYMTNQVGHINLIQAI